MERLGAQQASAGTSILRLSIEPLGNALPNFHEFVLGLLERRLRPAIAQKVATAAAELLDNAMAYATMTTDIVFEIRFDDSHVTVEVANTTVASRVRVLEKQIEKLREEPEQTYLEEMRHSMTERGPRPMMGLARTRHEAQMELSLRVQGDRIRIEARRSR